MSKYLRHFVGPGLLTIALLLPYSVHAQDAALVERATAGDPSAQVQLGVAYATGNGARRDGRLAVQWLTAAAESNGVSAASAAGWLGAIYRNGMGLKADGALALQWFTRGAELGSGASAQNIAEMYYDGKLLRKDQDQVELWYGRAASLYEAETAAGDNLAAYRLARIYNSGVGIPQDREKAITYLEKAAAAGVTEATTLLAEIKSERAQVAAPRARRANLPSTLDPSTGSTIGLVSPCPTGVSAIWAASQEVPFRVVIEVPSVEIFLDQPTFQALLTQSIEFTTSACGPNSPVTRARLSFLAPGFPDTLNPAANVELGRGFANAVRTGRSESVRVQNNVLIRKNRSSFLTSHNVQHWASFAALLGNPYALENRVVGVVADFLSMDGPTIGLFHAPADQTYRELGLPSPEPDLIAIADLPTSLFRVRGQRVLIAARVIGKTERLIGGVRIPLLSFLGAHMCTDSSCSDILP